MSTIFLHTQSPYPKIIRILRSLVLWAIIVYAGWFDFALSGVVSLFPDALLLSPKVGISWLFQPFTAVITIPYPGFGLSMAFDLLLINFFLTPIYTFVLSFLSEKHFLKFLIGLTIIGAGSFSIIAHFIHSPTPPCSLFSGLSLAVVIFWALLHRKGQSTLLLAFPISRTWAISLSALATLYAPVSGGEWARVGAIVSMSAVSYLWGIARWRLRSHIDGFDGCEQWVDMSCRNISRFMQWHVLRFFRNWFYK